MENMSISKKISGEFNLVEDKVRKALQENGFGIVTEINLKETFKNKLDINYRNYKILGACIPSLSYKVLQIEPNMGLLLPCNVVISEEDDGILVSSINPIAMVGMMQNEALNEVAEAVTSRLQKTITEL